MDVTWLVFSNKETGKVLAKCSAEETFPDEIESIVALLAYENGLEEDDIRVSAD